MDGAAAPPASAATANGSVTSMRPTAAIAPLQAAEAAAAARAATAQKMPPDPKRRRVAAALEDWFSHATYTDRNGKACSQAEWVQEGESKQHKMGPKDRCVAHLANRLRAEPDEDLVVFAEDNTSMARLKQLALDKQNGKKQNEGGSKQYRVFSRRGAYDYLCQKPAKSRHLYDLIDVNGEHRGGRYAVILAVDLDVTPGNSPPEKLARAAFLATVRTVIDTVIAMAARDGKELQYPRDFIVDDAFLPDGAGGSCHILVLPAGFGSIGEARAFMAHLKGQPGCECVDKTIPSRDGLFKTVGCCKKSVDGKKRPQLPNPDLAAAMPEKYRRDNVPFRDIVSVDEFERRRLVVRKDSPQFKWFPHVAVPETQSHKKALSPRAWAVLNDEPLQKVRSEVATVQRPATHMLLGPMPKHVAVDPANTDKLHAAIAAQWRANKRAHCTHEKRTKTTVLALDWDGGPCLQEAAGQSDGLSPLQFIHKVYTLDVKSFDRWWF